jgi:hypothetical protein
MTIAGRAPAGAGHADEPPGRPAVLSAAGVSV